MFNLNPPSPPDPITSWAIFNYFLITLSVVTGLIALLQVSFKISAKLKRSPLLFYGLDDTIRNKGAESRSLCNCVHKYKLHITGKSNVLNRIFPRIQYSHVCYGLLIICLVRRCCKAELILPKTQLNIRTHGVPRTYQIGFSPIPKMYQTDNYLWDLGLISEVIRIETESQKDCDHPWISPHSLVESQEIKVNYMGNCSTIIYMHLRQTNQPTMYHFCTYALNTATRMVEQIKRCAPDIKLI